MKNKIELSGIIKIDYGYFDTFNRIYLIQKDNYKIDLINRLTEATENYGKQVSVKYYVADKRCSKNKIQEQFIKKVMGLIDVGFNKEYYEYSEYSNGTDYNTIFDVGNHDLYSELVRNQNKFIILEIEFGTNKK